MKQNQQRSNPAMKPEFAGTNAQEVKKQIQKDVNAGQGAMTSREAGGMRD
ncbi:hypothetical protein [Falsibacillus pallidus]|uniref:Uncharacterized protein n=1 Tax=Falsibacillus pallidus TaxID=493781 RepID=A0A370FZ22_9BACI|nr:hypothetical protein [Falsibacillus pallidus]RDI36877.1 hypothetical protein DFR59_1252 [Falsibacillus pallidus]